MTLRRFVAVIFFVLTSLFVKGQQVHFVYLQTENSQPFYVKLDNKVTSSSSAGYLILPKLLEGDYNISVGFPKKEFPEESFQISIDKDNKGFLLKNFGEKGWGLFNLQSFALVMGNNSNSAPVAAKKLEDDPFSRMLANVVKDSSILEKNIVSEVTSQPANKASGIPATVDTTKANVDAISKNDNPGVKALDSVATNNEADIKNKDSTVVIIDSAKLADQNAKPLLLSVINRLLQKKNADGIEMVYVDRDEDNTDTIRIFIPANNNSATAKKEDSEIGKKDSSAIIKEDNVAETTIPDSVEKRETSANLNFDSVKTGTESAADTVKDLVNMDNTALASDINSDSVSNGLKPLKTIDITGDEIKKQDSIQKALPKVVNSTTTNSDCKAFASDDDFIKLRKKMAAENSNDEMIKLAKKYFRSECFSTEQIKNLSFLFLNDEGKYQFFYAAYAFTSDSSLYHVLQSQLKDPYYVNKFKAMIHK